MKRLTFLIIAISVFSIILNSSISKHSAYGEEYIMPSWLKDNEKWWSEGKISDSEYVSGIKYLIQHGMIQLEPKKNPAIKTIDVPDKNCLDRTFPKVNWANCD